MSQTPEQYFNEMQQLVTKLRAGLVALGRATNLDVASLEALRGEIEADIQSAHEQCKDMDGYNGTFSN